MARTAKQIRHEVHARTVRRRRSRVVFGGAWFGVVAALAFASLVITGGARAQARSCSDPVALPGPERPLSKPPTLKADDDSSIVMRFGDSRARDEYFVPLETYERRLTQGDFKRDGGLDVLLAGGYLKRDASNVIALTGDGLTATLAPVSARRVDLCMTVDPHDVRQLAPGTYRGTAAVVYGIDKTPLASVPVELTFRASRWTAIVVAFVAVGLGVVVKVLSEAAARQRETGVSAVEALKGYSSQLSLPLGLIFAAVAGSLAFLQMYGGSNDWGANSGDFAKLFGVCFIAQMSTSEGIDAIRRVAGGAHGVHTTTTASV